MKKLFPLFAMLSLGLLAGGCGKSATDEALAGIKDYKNKMCACKTAECAEKLDEEQDKWQESMRKKVGDKKPSDSFLEAFDKAEDEYRECRDKATAGAPE